VAYVLVLVVLAVALYSISAPLRAQRRNRDGESVAPDIGDLEAARDAKYHEIRDAELDLRTGKLSDEDYMAIDTALRGEALEILHELDRTRAAQTATIEP
jgi:hypothetical protein